jgi:hypothetical protein
LLFARYVCKPAAQEGTLVILTGDVGPLFCFAQLHNSLNGGCAGQGGIDDVLPLPPLDPEALLDPAALLVP